MKLQIRLFFVAALMIAPLTAQANSPFNGFNAGAGVGWNYNRVELDVKGGGNAKESKSFLPVGVFINYMYSMPDAMLWVLEASIDYDFGSEIKYADSADGFTNNNRPKVNKQFTALLTPKFGYNFQDNWIGYILVGLGGTNWKTKALGNTRKNFMLTIAPGFGGELKFSDCWKLGFEYKYLHYFGRDNTYGITPTQAKISTNPSSHDLRLRLSFNFGEPTS